MYIIAFLLGLAGLLFVVSFGSNHKVGTLIVGLLMMAAAFVLGWLNKAKAPERTIVQKIDLSGDIEKEQLQCNSCSAPLDKNSITLEEGALVVNCPYCGTSYHLEEAPKW